MKSWRWYERGTKSLFLQGRNFFSPIKKKGNYIFIFNLLVFDFYKSQKQELHKTKSKNNN